MLDLIIKNGQCYINGELKNIDVAIKKYEYDKFNKVFVWNAFTELVTLALIRVKEFEASNIATIAFGIANNIEKKTIQENLTS